MKHVSILVLNNSRINSIDNPRHAFEEVNKILLNEGKPPLFEIQFAGITSIEFKDKLLPFKV